VVAVYEYQCNRCGRFDVRLAIGTAPEDYRCPECASASRRVFTPPLLGNTSKQLGALLSREEQSRDDPEVVHQLPARPGIRPEPPTHPALARLPKP
jgi:putative FmdB family regulatory protein